MLKYQKKNQQIKGKNLVSQRLYAKEQKINSIIKSKRISDEKKPNVENKLGELSRKTIYKWFTCSEAFLDRVF